MANVNDKLHNFRQFGESNEIKPRRLYNFHNLTEQVMPVNRIKELRQERGWLQKDLEQAMNLGRGNVSKYEKEDRALSSPLIRQFCEIFGCTADYLLGMSTQQTLSISDEDAALLEAYHAAPPDTQAGIATILRPFMEVRTSLALSDEQEGERHG